MEKKSVETYWRIFHQNDKRRDEKNVLIRRDEKKKRGEEKHVVSSNTTTTTSTTTTSTTPKSKLYIWRTHLFGSVNTRLDRSWRSINTLTLHYYRWQANVAVLPVCLFFLIFSPHLSHRLCPILIVIVLAVHHSSVNETKRTMYCYPSFGYWTLENSFYYPCSQVEFDWIEKATSSNILRSIIFRYLFLIDLSLFRR